MCDLKFESKQGKKDESVGTERNKTKSNIDIRTERETLNKGNKQKRHRINVQSIVFIKINQKIV